MHRLCTKPHVPQTFTNQQFRGCFKSLIAPEYAPLSPFPLKTLRNVENFLPFCREKGSQSPRPKILKTLTTVPFRAIITNARKSDMRP